MATAHFREQTEWKRQQEAMKTANIFVTNFNINIHWQKLIRGCSAPYEFLILLINIIKVKQMVLVCFF